MNHGMTNKGVVTYGGGATQITSSAIGDGARVTIGNPACDADEPPESVGASSIGIVTILAEEARAVITEFGLEEDRTKARGQWFYTGVVHTPTGVVDVIATRASGPGQRATMTALGNLWRHYSPSLLALVGIGGAIHPTIALDDVVVATRVIYYDLRKVTPAGTRHRGEEAEAPAWTVHAVNSFFTHHGDPAPLCPEHGPSFRVFPGPVGSGEAVIADKHSDIRAYLHAYNEKTLAVDMEAGGLSRFCHETTSASGTHPGWIVIRGISDHANHEKSDNRHVSAARNAAHTLRQIIPYVHARG